jgi:hypothetical protein
MLYSTYIIANPIHCLFAEMTERVATSHIQPCILRFVRYQAIVGAKTASRVILGTNYTRVVWSISSSRSLLYILELTIGIQVAKVIINIMVFVILLQKICLGVVI